MAKFGVIKIGKSRPSKKMVDVDFFLDKKAMRNIPKLGLKMIKDDPDALVGYVITKALENIAKPNDRWPSWLS